MKQRVHAQSKAMPGTRKGHLAVLVTALAGCTLLTACQSVGPDFVRPDSAWLDDWQDASTEAATAGLPQPDQPPPDDWWHNFNDPVLDQLITDAQRLNPGVRTAGLRIMEARAQLGIASSGRYPQVQQLSGDASRAREQKTGEPSTLGESYSAGLFVGWEIDFWGKFRRGIESADAAYLASIAQYDDIHVLQTHLVVEFFLFCHRIGEMLNIAWTGQGNINRFGDLRARRHSHRHQRQHESKNNASLHGTSPEKISG